MITFSKKSWHYKFNEFFEFKDGPWADALECKSICAYFWCTMWNIGASLVFLSFVWITGIGAGLPVLEKLVGGVEGTLVNFSWVWLVGIGAILLFVAAFFFIVFLLTLPYIGFLKYKEKTYKEGENSVDNHPNVFVEWVRAKKVKVCPMIEFKE